MHSAFNVSRLGEVLPVSIWLIVLAAVSERADRSRSDRFFSKRLAFNILPIFAKSISDIIYLQFNLKLYIKKKVSSNTNFNIIQQ